MLSLVPHPHPPSTPAPGLGPPLLYLDATEYDHFLSHKDEPDWEWPVPNLSLGRLQPRKAPDASPGSLHTTLYSMGCDSNPGSQGGAQSTLDRVALHHC